MLNIPRLSIGQNHYLMRELTFNSAIKIAKMPSEHIEKRLTVFLQDTLQDDLLPLTMTVQERYALLLNYLDAAQNTLLGMGANVKDFLIQEPKAFIPQIDENNIMVKQLTGFDAELLESGCLNLADWLAASLALQLQDNNSAMPPMLDHLANEDEKAVRFGERIP